MKNYTLLLAVLAIMPAFAQPGKFAVPAGAELDKFPIQPKMVTLAKQAELGLSAKRLDTPVDVNNYDRSVRGGRFVFETLPAGTLVLVDKNGMLRYKADCGNRLVEPAKCTPCHITNAAGLIGGSGNGQKSAARSAGLKSDSTPGAWSHFWNGAKKAWDAMWGAIGSLLGILLPLLLLLLLLAFLAGLLYLLIRAIRDWWRRRNAPPPPAPPPAPVPAPVVPPVAPAAVGPAAGGAAPVPPPAPAAFPANRAVIDIGDPGNAHRAQVGANIGRVEFDRDPATGAVTVRIFER